MVTINDVARRSGFSKTTVSFVLNDAPLAKNIAAVTKAKIKRVAKDLGYRPNQFARYLRSKRSNMIGVVLFDISDPYCVQILRGVEQALYKSDSHLLILADVQNNPSRFKNYVRMLLERQVEGLIALGNSVYPEDELLDSLRECRTPAVIIGRELENGLLSSVTVDNEYGARVALEHLYDLGHRKIAFLRGPKVMIDSGQRWKGIEAFARSVRLPLDSSLVLDSPLRNAGQEAGYELTRRLLPSKEGFYRPARPRRRDRFRSDSRTQRCWHRGSPSVLGHRLRRYSHVRLLQSAADHHPSRHGDARHTRRAVVARRAEAAGRRWETRTRAPAGHAWTRDSSLHVASTLGWMRPLLPCGPWRWW